MENDFLSDFGKGGFGGDSHKIQKISGGELEKFSKSVLEQLIKDNVPPIPENYKIYFIKALHEQSTMTFRKKISEMMNFEDVEDSKQVFIEKAVKKGFGDLSLLMQDVAMVYKNVEVMEDVLQKAADDLSVKSYDLSLKELVSSLQNNLQRFEAVLKKYSSDIKEHFENVLTHYKQIEEKSDFDTVYEAYRKKSLLDLIEKCKDGYAKYNYQNSIIMLKIKDDLINKISKQKDKVILQKNIVKTLNKNVDNSDIVAYYGDGIFAILLRHTNMQNAQKKTENLIDAIYNTNFFIDGVEIDMNLEAALAVIKDDIVVDKFLQKMIKSLSKTGKDQEPFAIID